MADFDKALEQIIRDKFTKLERLEEEKTSRSRSKALIFMFAY